MILQLTFLKTLTVLETGNIVAVGNPSFSLAAKY